MKAAQKKARTNFGWILYCSSSVIRIAVIGVGDVAQRDYLPELGRLAAKALLVSACSRSSGRAEDVARRYEIPHWTTSYDEVLARGDVDAVLNLTPIQAHEQITLAALAAGKHVYTEKPLALSADAGRRIREAAERAGRIVVAAPSVLLYPQVRWTEQALRDGIIGPVRAARAYASAGPPPWEGYASDPSAFFAAGAGPLVDMGIYPLHALTGLLGEVRRVSSMAAQVRRSFVVSDGPAAGKTVPIEVPDSWQVIMELANGALASLQADFVSLAADGPELELFGDDGTIGLSLLDVSQPVRVFDGADWRDERVPHERAEGPDHVLGVEHLVDCIESGMPPRLSLDHGIHVLDVLERARVAHTVAPTLDTKEPARP